MKKVIWFLFLSIFLFGSCITPAGRRSDEIKGKISISGAWALYPMAVKWSEEFKKLHPEVQIDISAGGAGKGMTDAVSGLVDIGMVSRSIYPEELSKGAYPVAMVKDAVVAVANISNPSINIILKKGLTKEEVVSIWISGTAKNWSQVIRTASNVPIHVYTRSDACGAAETWAKYLGKKQEDLLGSAVYGDPGLALAVQKDILGIGYNNIAYAYDHATRKQIEGLRVIPLDLNNDGKIDPEENFYSTYDEIVKAISDDKYPSPPARELYFVTKGKPQNRLVSEFMRWALTDGQKFIKEAGYIGLSADRIKTEFRKL